MLNNTFDAKSSPRWRWPLVIFGLALAGIAAFSPWVGLGGGENFFIYQILNVSRRECALFGLMTATSAALQPLYGLLLRYAGRSAGFAAKYLMGSFRWLARFFYVTVVVVFVLIAAEIFQRSIETDPTAYFIFPPNTARTIHIDPNVIHGVQPVARFEVNAYGLRGKPPGQDRQRILVLGGSTVESFIQDESNAWPAQLQKLINEFEGDQKTWVGNGGRSGLSSFENIIQLRHLPGMLPKLDTAIVFTGGNDLAYGYINANEPSFKPTPEEVRYDRTFFTIARPKTDFPKNLALYRLYLSIQRTWMLSGRGVLQAGGTGKNYMDWVVRTRAERQAAKPLLDTLPDLSPFLEVYRSNLNKMVDLAAARKLKLVLVTQPLMYRAGQSPEDEAIYSTFGKVKGYTDSPDSDFYSSAALDTMMGMYNKVTLEVCALKNISCIDAASRVEPTRDNYYDGMHFTDAGNRALAQVVFEGLKSFRLVGKH